MLMVLKNGETLGPFWGKAVRTSSGRDHLGMWTTSIATYARLLPGLTTQTLRIRYYSFYTWVLNHYIYKLKSKNQLDLWVIMRRAELLFAFSTFVFSDKQQGYPGIKFIKGKFTQDDVLREKVFNFAVISDATSNSYWKHRKGAFGQYYFAPLRTIGIIGEDDKGELTITPKGKDLADAFQFSISEDLGDIFIKAIVKGEIKTSDLKNICTRINCSSVPLKSRELKLLIKLLLEINNDDNFRRETILSIIKSALLTNIVKPTELPLTIYFNSTRENKAIKFDEFNTTSELWRFYQINEFSHFAFETIFCFILRQLQKDAYWVGVDVCVELFIAEVMNTINKILPDVNRIKRTTLITEILKNTETFKKVTWHKVGSPLQLSTLCEKVDVSAAILLIFVLFVRHQNEFSSFSTLAKKHGVARDGCFLQLFDNLKKYKTRTFEEFLRHTLVFEIINRHLRVAYQKIAHSSHNTLKFAYESEQIMWLDNFDLAWTHPRLVTLMNFLRDLNVLDSKGFVTKLGCQLNGN